MKKSDPMMVAILRALPTAVLTAAALLFVLLPSEISTRTLISAVGGVFCTTMIGRGAVEGWYDQKQKPLQNVPPASELDGARQ